MPADAALLADIPLFSHMDAEERAALAAFMDDVRFSAGHEIFKEGTPGQVCYLLRSGRVELSVKEKGRDKVVIDLLEPGELFGELSLLDLGTRSATAVAVGDVDALVLERQELVEFLRRFPDAALDVMASLAKRIRRADALIKRSVQNPNETIEERATWGERIADGVAIFGGSWAFVISFLLVLAAWVTLNVAVPRPWDTYPFILLNLFLSMVAALQAPVIMMSQNRQDAKDRIRSEADYQVNVKAHAAILELHEKLDRLAEGRGRDGVD